MKKLLVYASLTGNSKKCAEMIAEKLPDVDVIDLKKEKAGIDGYDMVIIGGGYYAGSLQKKVKKFIKNNAEKLKNKPYALFVTCGSEDDYKETLIKNIGEELVNGAVAVECFGSEVNPDKQKGFMKIVQNMMVKAYNKDNKPLHNIHEDKIDEFCLKIKSIRTA